MNGTQLQAKLYGGYAKAALRLGLPFNQYRPTVAMAPAISAANLMQSLPVSLNAEDMTYSKPHGYAKATWYCLADGSQLRPGDYLVRPDGVPFFIAAMQPLLPILAIECNRILTISIPQKGSGVGQRGYGGTTAANSTQILNQWPASVLQGSKGEKSQVNLPGDVRQPWWIVLLPNLSGNVLLQTDYAMTDDIGRRYVISSAEQSEQGWRLSASEEGT